MVETVMARNHKISKTRWKSLIPTWSTAPIANEEKGPIN